MRSSFGFLISRVELCTLIIVMAMDFLRGFNFRKGVVGRILSMRSSTVRTDCKSPLSLYIHENDCIRIVLVKYF
jgi:hypothetical protein